MSVHAFQYGNAENFLGDAGDGTMEAISITNDTRGTMHGASHGAGPGPWIWGGVPKYPYSAVPQLHTKEFHIDSKKSGY